MSEQEVKAKPIKRDLVKKRKHENDDDYDNEDVIQIARQFPIVMRRPLIWGMLIILVGLLPWAYAVGNLTSWVNYSVWWLVACAAFLIYYWFKTWVSWFYSVYVLTDKRIMITHQRGLFDREVSELALNNIQNVTYAIKGLQAVLFHFGNINIQTLSGSGGFEIKTMHRPEHFSKAIIRAAGISGSTAKRD